MTGTPPDRTVPGHGVSTAPADGRTFGGDWDGLPGAGLEALANPLWRAYCDGLHADVIRDWVGAGRFRITLKTDLFEEAQGEGLADFLAASGDSLLGIDLSMRVVARARERHPWLSAAVADVRHLPLASESIDFVVSISTLDHFAKRSDLTLALGELARVLAPGGRLFITLDNPVNPIVALRNRLPASWFGRTSILPYFVGHTLSLPALRRELENLGLGIVHSGHILHAPRIGFLHLCTLPDPTSRPARWLLHLMRGWENFARWPTAPISGYFVAVLAGKR